MDVAMPIRSVIPSLDGPVLAALAATTAPLALSGVHRLAGRGSLSGVRRVLARLVDDGVVLTVPGGYVLNRSHVAAPAIEVLANLHGELAHRIRAFVEAWAEPVELLALFGSAARRDGNAESDIDLLVVSESPHLEDLLDGLRQQVSTWSGNTAHVIGSTRSNFARLRADEEPIVGSWEREAQVLLGNPALLRRAAR